MASNAVLYSTNLCSSTCKNSKSVRQFLVPKIVGYQQNPVAGYKMMTPTFKSMSGEATPIDEFTVSGASDGMTSIQVMNSEGSWTGTYYWFNALGEYPAGWFDVTGSDPAGIELQNGDAVFFYTEESDISAGNAGEVSNKETVRDIAGYQMVGNCSPVEIDIDSLEVLNASDGMTSIQIMNSEGSWTGTYYWFNALGEYPAGWFDVTGSDPAGITLKPGDAVFFYTEESGIQAVIPSAL